MLKELCSYIAHFYSRTLYMCIKIKVKEINIHKNINGGLNG